jgi:hypothetical protein
MPVIKRNADTFTRVLDGLLQYGSLGKASAVAGIDSFTLSRWRRLSEDGAEEFQEVSYRGIIAPFHAHVNESIEESVDAIESNFRASARDGRWRPVLHHGQYCYEPSETAHAMSEQQFQDAVELGIEWPDKLKRVFNEATGQWERVRMLEWLPPSTEAQLAILRSWSERYADKRSLSVSGRLDVSANLGVTVIGQRTLTPPTAPAPPQLEIIPSAIVDTANDGLTDAIFAEVEPDEPMPDFSPDKFVADPSSPLTVEQQQVLARARAGNQLAADLANRALARKNSPVQPAPPPPPPAPVYRGDLDQPDDVPRTPIGKKII